MRAWRRRPLKRRRLSPFPIDRACVCVCLCGDGGGGGGSGGGGGGCGGGVPVCLCLCVFACWWCGSGRGGGWAGSGAPPTPPRLPTVPSSSAQSEVEIAPFRACRSLEIGPFQSQTNNVVGAAQVEPVSISPPPVNVGAFTGIYTGVGGCSSARRFQAHCHVFTPFYRVLRERNCAVSGLSLRKAACGWATRAHPHPPNHARTHARTHKHTTRTRARPPARARARTHAHT